MFNSTTMTSRNPAVAPSLDVASVRGEDLAGGGILLHPRQPVRLRVHAARVAVTTLFLQRDASGEYKCFHGCSEKAGAPWICPRLCPG